MSREIEAILKRATDGCRISCHEAVTLLQSHDLVTIGRAAHTIRMKKADPTRVTYIIDRNVNYTNICEAACNFCAFYCTPDDENGYLISDDEMDKKIEETIALGGDQILLQGGLHPDLPLSWYEALLARIKERHGIHLHAFSGPEIVHFSQLSGLSIAAVIKRLKAAGLDSIPGGGAEILVDRVRNSVSPHKCSADQWIDVMRQAHLLDMRTTATMMFGHEETLEERVESLDRIRSLQDETGGFTAFIPWPFQPDNSAMAGTAPTGGHAYMTTLAVSRLFLDNIDNIQASWVTMGSKVAQISLFFGANDAGSTMIEENVVAAAGVAHRLSEKELRRLVTESGFEPQRRNMNYTTT